MMKEKYFDSASLIDLITQLRRCKYSDNAISRLIRQPVYTGSIATNDINPTVILRADLIRISMELRFVLGLGIRSIARITGVAPSTIRRERNRIDPSITEENKKLMKEQNSNKQKLTAIIIRLLKDGINPSRMVEDIRKHHGIEITTKLINRYINDYFGSDIATRDHYKARAKHRCSTKTQILSLINDGCTKSAAARRLGKVKSVATYHTKCLVGNPILTGNDDNVHTLISLEGKGDSAGQKGKIAELLVASKLTEYERKLQFELSRIGGNERLDMLMTFPYHAHNPPLNIQIRTVREPRVGSQYVPITAYNGSYNENNCDLLFACRHSDKSIYAYTGSKVWHRKSQVSIKDGVLLTSIDVLQPLIEEAIMLKRNIILLSNAS